MSDNQNLANPTRITKINHAPGFYKSIALDVLAIASSAFFGYLYFRYVAHGLSVWILLGGLALFAIFSALQTFLTKSAGRRALVLLLEVLALLVFFRTDDWRILAITGGAMFVLSFWGYLSSRAYLNNSIEVPFFGVTRDVLGKFTTAILIFMVLIYVPQLNDGTPFVSQQNFSGFFDWSAGLINNFYPHLSLTGSFGDFADSVAKMELENNQTFQTLNAQQQSAAVSQAADQFKQTFAKNAAAPIAASDPTSNAFYNLLVGALNAWKGQSSGSFAIGWAIVAFFVLRSLGIVFVWFAQFLTLIFYEILLASGFMKIAEETQAREAIGY